MSLHEMCSHGGYSNHGSVVGFGGGVGYAERVHELGQYVGKGDHADSGHDCDVFIIIKPHTTMVPATVVCPRWSRPARRSLTATGLERHNADPRD